MNYQHAFHAGNFADVHKHVVLTRILTHLRLKEAPFRVIDTHAGAGRYDLLSDKASRSGEWHDGIERLWQAAPAQALLAPYLEILTTLNPRGALRYYPGSPLIVASLLRARDRLIACELEAGSAGALRRLLHEERRAKVLTIDGWMALGATIPPKERRGLVLIDPPFEERDEFARLSDVLGEAHRKWPTGIYMLWYPIKERAAPDALARRLRRLGVPKILRCEMILGPPRADAGLTGSGLMLVNPPFTLDRELRVVLPALARIFSPDAVHRLDWLVEEK
jgi:23S rRNA (adenine2030-N6)-methyltransferase